MRKVNRYFFGSETIAGSDYVWFYGMQALAVSITAIALFY